MADSSVQKFDDQEAQVTVNTLDDIKRVSLIFVKSGMFKADNREDEEKLMYQAGVKIIAGKEFGIAPFAAMRGINIIKGNAEMSANLMAAKVKRHPKYDYRVKQWDNDGCVLEFYEIPYPGASRKEWELLGESSFDLDDAKQAGLAGGENWRKFSRNMFFARSISNGVRIHCPDIFYGAPVYTDGEISGDFEGEDDPQEPETTQPDRADEAREAEVVTDEPELDDDLVESEEPETEESDPAADAPMITEAQLKKMMGLLKEIGATDSDERHTYLTVALNRKVTSSKDLTRAEAAKAIDQLEADRLDDLKDKLADLMHEKFNSRQIRAAIGKLHTAGEVQDAIAKMEAESA